MTNWFIASLCFWILGNQVEAEDNVQRPVIFLMFLACHVMHWVEVWMQ